MVLLPKLSLTCPNDRDVDGGGTLRAASNKERGGTTRRGGSFAKCRLQAAYTGAAVE